MQSHIVIVIVIVITTSYIAPLVASHFQDASQERSLSALYLILGITDQVQFQLFFESREGFGFPNSFRKTRNRNRKLLISREPTKAKSQEPAYSQALNQNKIDRQRSRSRESGRQTVRRLWWMVFGVETGMEAWG